MTFAGWIEISLVLALVLGAAWPLGASMADVFEGRRSVLSPMVGPLERSFYRLSGVDPQKEQNWLDYTISMIVFTAGCFMALYITQRLQGVLPFNPQGRDAVPPDLAFNTAISFITNANWQAYAGETTMSHFTQMAGLTTHNFLDTAVAMALAVGLTRALARGEAETIGNFWVDMTRATLYVLLPISILVALIFVALGIPQTLQGSIEATTLEGARQSIAIGPVASQEAIKLIGTNGGGFFNANSAHPFENPNAWSNMLECWCQLVLAVAFVFTFGRMVDDPRQGRGLLAAMAFIFIVSLAMLYRAEAIGNPLLTAIGVDPSDGNLEGKELRFSQASAALFAVATTGTGTGAAKCDIRLANADWRSCAAVQSSDGMYRSRRRWNWPLWRSSPRHPRGFPGRTHGGPHARISRQEDRGARNKIRDAFTAPSSRTRPGLYCDLGQFKGRSRQPR
jgi:K+-transporting ATPase ATPase A chain